MHADLSLTAGDEDAGSCQQLQQLVLDLRASSCQASTTLPVRPGTSTILFVDKCRAGCCCHASLTLDADKHACRAPVMQQGGICLLCASTTHGEDAISTATPPRKLPGKEVDSYFRV